MKIPLVKRKGWRKRMRLNIRAACDDSSKGITTWVEAVRTLVDMGIPMNLIMKESNTYGVQKQNRKP